MNEFTETHFKLIQVCKQNDNIFPLLEEWYKKQYLMENCCMSDLVQVIWPIFFKIWQNKCDKWSDSGEALLLEVICKPYLGGIFSMCSFGHGHMTEWGKEKTGNEWSKDFVYSMCNFIRFVKTDCLPGYVEFLQKDS